MRQWQSNSQPVEAEAVQCSVSAIGKQYVCAYTTLRCELKPRGTQAAASSGEHFNVTIGLQKEPMNNST